MKKKLSDIVLKNIYPPDYKKNLTVKDMAEVLVQRLGLKRKKARANHARLLIELLKFKKDNIPVTIEQIAGFLEVSQSQAYEEIRKWRTIGIIEHVKIPQGINLIKGYMLTASTINRLMDKVESSLNSFTRRTRRIAKDFDDAYQLELIRPSVNKNIEEVEENNEE